MLATATANDEQLLSIEEVAQRLNVTVKIVRTLTLKGKLRYVKVGRKIRFRRSWVEAFIESQR